MSIDRNSDWYMTGRNRSSSHQAGIKSHKPSQAELNETRKQASYKVKTQINKLMESEGLTKEEATALFMSCRTFDGKFKFSQLKLDEIKLKSINTASVPESELENIPLPESDNTQQNKPKQTILSKLWRFLFM